MSKLSTDFNGKPFHAVWRNIVCNNSPSPLNILYHSSISFISAGNKNRNLVPRHAMLSSIQTYLLLFGIIDNLAIKITLWEEIAYRGHEKERNEAKSSSLDALRHSVLQPELSHKRHFACSRLASRGYFRSRMSRYPNGVSTFYLIRLYVSLDVNLNVLGE